MGHVIQGREVQMPVEVRDAEVAAATFLVSAAAVDRLIGSTGLSVAQVMGGRALCSLAFIDYKDNDLGDYNEVAVAFLVRPHDGTKGMAPYIHRLPVDQSFTCEAGQTIWGFPKWVTSMAITDEGRTRSIVLSEDGRHILTLAVRRSPVPFPSRDLVMHAYSLRDGVLRRTRWTTRNAGVHGRPGGAVLVLGAGHPMADELRSIGLPRRALMTSTVARMAATFDEPELC
jgi:hypothetical protein